MQVCAFYLMTHTSGVFCSWWTVASHGMPFFSAVPFNTCLAPTFMSANSGLKLMAALTALDSRASPAWQGHGQSQQRA